MKRDCRCYEWFFPARFLEAMKILNNFKTIAEGLPKN